jgi:molybdopterin-containing oxidoreductase family iron-sulfur binding subunit
MLEEIRAKLAGASGPAYWRSLEEAADSLPFRELLRNEFPSLAAEWEDGPSRRRFLQLMGASLALGGLTACTKQPVEKIAPFVRQPEEMVPGRPLYYASGSTLGGYASGILVESHLGRPTKIEGNPDHPASLGATDATTQASILDLYDPDRLKNVLHLGRTSTWESFASALAASMAAQKGLGGAGFRLLTQTVTSPSLTASIDRLLALLPSARWHQWEAAGRHAPRSAARRAFGSPAEIRYDLSKAKVLVTLDSDLLVSGPGAVRYARDFAARRRIEDGKGEMNRFYAIESSPSAGAALADHRLPLSPSEVAAFGLALAAEIGLPVARPSLPERAVPVARAIAKELLETRGASLVVAGETTSTALQVVVSAINERIGAFGATVIVSEPVESRPIDQTASLAGLVADLEAGRVDTLVIVGGNPVFDAPADLSFGRAIGKAKTLIRLALHDDETTERCHWAIPAAHELESWGDARSYDGTVTMIQPLIEPLYDGKSPWQLLAAMLGNSAAKGDEPVRGYWRDSVELGGADFESKWRKAVHDGFVAGSGRPHRASTVRPEAVAEAEAEIAANRSTGEALEVSFRPDPSLHDGRFANNGWLQELPRPITKITWDNPALVSPALAASRNLRNGDVVALGLGGRTIELPVWIVPGHADRAISLFFGSGRRRTGRVGSGTGFDVYPLRSSGMLGGGTGVSLSKSGRTATLASTEGHFAIDEALAKNQSRERGLVRVATIADLAKDPQAIRRRGERPSPELSFYPSHRSEGYAWGIAIDLNVCTGCNGCVVACQAENNIPVVGKEQVANGREMHWIRIDRYYEGSSLELPAIHHQPVMCMQCEQAPCEPVCPVAATTHSPEGLNDMVYNRCVGTRYCSNNCPYKVRRFNFLKYNDTDTPVLDLLRNPDVTVRSRGVMEKCTYCVQRINHARIDAEREGRSIRDGEIVTACQQACPTEAIVFGNVNDPDSKVSRAKRRITGYGLLEELNTRPRTTYLAKLRNPNPDLGEIPT